MGKISKVVVCGQRGCGKTALLEQLIYGNHDIGGPHCPTIEDIYVANVETDRGVREKVRFYDTAGLDSSNNEIPRHYLTFAEGFILVYSITSSESFARVDHIKKDIDRHRDKKEITIVVIGNKCDLEADRQVDISTAQNWASREKVRLFEVSVMDKKTLTEPFTYITSKMNQPPSKSSFPLGRKTKGTNQSDT